MLNLFRKWTDQVSTPEPDTQDDTLLMAIASRSGRERRTLAQAKQYIGTNEGLARYLAEERASK